VTVDEAGQGLAVGLIAKYAQPKATTNVIENTSLSAKFARQISRAFYLAQAEMRPVQNLIEAQTPIVT
jgi:hypothetical protein